MKQIQQFTAIIEKEADLYVSLCPELDIASQGETVEEAKANLTEALELFFETASSTESEAAIEVLSEQTLFSLTDEEWDNFCLVLEAPPKHIPALRKLLSEKSVFDGE